MNWKDRQVKISEEEAIRLAKSGHWEAMTYRERAEFQMLVGRLSMPFDVFHEALEKTLGRGVWTHELALNWDGICEELFKGKAAPTMQEIMELIPADKRVVIALE